MRALFCVLLISFLSFPACSACTIFTATEGETTWFAGNEDQRPNNAYLIVDTSGTFGVFYIATPWQQWPMVMQTGLNEAGLSFDANWIPTESLASHPERSDPGEWPVTYMMKNAATVEQVIELTQTYNWGTSMAYQVHFADASGDAAVIHPGPNGELTITRKTDSFLVSTNFNLKRLRTGDYSCVRYETASSTLSSLDEFNLENMASVLEATHQEGEFSTIYSTIYDLTGRQIWLYIDSDFDNPIQLDFYSELQKGDQQINIGQLFSDNQSEGSWVLNTNWAIYLTLGIMVVAISYKISKKPDACVTAIH